MGADEILSGSANGATKDWFYTTGLMRDFFALPCSLGSRLHGDIFLAQVRQFSRIRRRMESRAASA